MNILQVNTADRGGGAEGSARALFEAYRARGHRSWLAVGQRLSDDPDVLEIPPGVAPSAAGRLLQRLARRLRQGTGRRPAWSAGLARRLEILADPERRHAWRHGLEDMAFPNTAGLLERCPALPDVVHCHNLHGGYFDLRELAAISRRVPLILNLRDTWLLTGHCGYFIDCQRWRHGCGHCPDLHRYPPVRRDGTAANWQRKAAIFAQCRVAVTAPSQWLLDQARESMLQAEEYRLIPNGIDLEAFRPGDRAADRARLGLPAEVPVVMVAAASRRNVYKDPETQAAGLRALAAAWNGPARPVVLCVGAAPDPSGFGGLTVHAEPYQSHPGALAACYRAADVFVHTARAEAFGKTVTEAMACGTPVVASAVGGIPEQLSDGREGFLCPPGDAAALAARLLDLLSQPQRRADCAAAALRRAQDYDVRTQVSRFLEWYEDLIQARRVDAAGVPADSP